MIAAGAAALLVALLWPGGDLWALSYYWKHTRAEVARDVARMEIKSAVRLLFYGNEHLEPPDMGLATAILDNPDREGLQRELLKELEAGTSDERVRTVALVVGFGRLAGQSDLEARLLPNLRKRITSLRDSSERKICWDNLR